jgi:hypothetical protein
LGVTHGRATSHQDQTGEREKGSQFVFLLIKFLPFSYPPVRTFSEPCREF